MDLSKLSSNDFKQITRLIERKENLLAEVEKIDSTLGNYDLGAMPARKSPGRPRSAARSTATRKATTQKTGRRPRGRPRGSTRAASSRKTGATRRGRPAGRGQLKESILKELRSAGKEGIAVKDLAQRLNTKPANIHAWFFSTGKKINGIKKIAGGRYRLDK